MRYRLVSAKASPFVNLFSTPTFRRLTAPFRGLRSLQWQLAASYAAMAALLCTALGLILMQLMGRVLLDQDRVDAQSRAIIAGGLLYRNLGGDLAVLLSEASQDVRARVCAYDSSGNRQDCSASGVLLPPESQFGETIDYDVAPARAPIASHTAIVGNQASSVFGYVTVDELWTDRGAALRRAQEGIFKLSLVATAVAAGAGLLLGRGLTAPLRGLTEATRHFGAGNLQARAPEDGDDEIGELGSGFNRMAAQLQESFTTLESERDALRTFIADMSHEIRTPITALRTFNDLLSQGAAADEAVRDEFLNESAVQIERLEWLAQNLLDLSKFDAGLAEVHLQRTDLRAPVTRAVDEARLLGERKGVSVAFQAPAMPVEASVDAERLHQALSNILLNAAKFTPSGGEIMVDLGRRKGQVAITVRDTGPGITADELPHIFERFYRGPSTSTLVSGSGLGLPIVQSIMHVHNGDVEIKSDPGHGTEVVLWLPDS